jgi:Fe-S oxidoreductase
MTLDSQPDWIKGIKARLDYRWHYRGERGILPDTTILLDETKEIIDKIAAANGINYLTSIGCFQCGTCSAICPYTLLPMAGSELSARRMLHEAQLGLTDFESEQTWLCTTCGTCLNQCPRGVEITDFMKGLRRLIVEVGAGYYPKSLQATMSSIAGLGNPFGEPREERAGRLEPLKVKPYAEGMEVCYFLGCFPAYDPRASQIAQATTAILQQAGVDFGILGASESCCGESVRRAGNEELFQKLARSNIQAFKENGVTKIVTTSPHCYHTLKNEYPALGAEVEVIHYTQYLAQLIREGRLKFRNELNKKVTYHDPCYLGRHNGVYDEPREILRSLPGLELIEMSHSGQKSLCCGGGGGRIWLEAKKGERFADLRLEQAVETGADTMAVACPYCLANFEDSLLSADDGGNIEIKDITELVWEVVKPS